MIGCGCREGRDPPSPCGVDERIAAIVSASIGADVFVGVGDSPAWC